MPSPSVLISGASIAGPALASWLSAAGAAFAAYEQRMRPMVTASQKSAPTMGRLAHPGSRLERSLLQRPLLRAGAWAAASPLVARLGRLSGGEPFATDALPDYPIA